MQPVKPEEVTYPGRVSDVESYVFLINRELFKQSVPLATRIGASVYHPGMTEADAYKIRDMYGRVGWDIVFEPDFSASKWWVKNKAPLMFYDHLVGHTHEAR